MAWRFRKSVNIGGFRINFSKTGIGYSFGAAGLRYTKKSDGGTRLTSSIRETGISYQKDWSKKENKTFDKNEDSIEPNFSEKDVIQSELEQSTQNDLVDKFNNAYTQNTDNKKKKTWLIVISIISLFLTSSNVLFIIPFIGLLVWALCLPKKIYIDLDYDFEDNDEIETKYNNINEGLDYLMSCDKVWEVNSTTANYNTKQHAGARSLLGLNSNVKLVEDVKYVNTNIDLKMLDIQNKKLLFLPDIILVLEDNAWVSVSYEDFEIEYRDSRFVESGNVPNDAEILGYDWLYQNKDGSRDKRYSNNKQIPVCAYALIKMTSKNGLQIVIMTSNREKTQEFYNRINEYVKK